ncbi:hypothetical protein ACPPVQ_13680 [Diaminobutyricibacter sp. McL0618]|uniref:hypothetical protein n=1 Tax=Leifsonia sp. McL0618 TaxID=3415677 RepID=UPI003CEFB074
MTAEQNLNTELIHTGPKRSFALPNAKAIENTAASLAASVSALHSATALAAASTIGSSVLANASRMTGYPDLSRSMGAGLAAGAIGSIGENARRLVSDVDLSNFGSTILGTTASAAALASFEVFKPGSIAMNSIPRFDLSSFTGSIAASYAPSTIALSTLASAGVLSDLKKLNASLTGAAGSEILKTAAATVDSRIRSVQLGFVSPTGSALGGFGRLQTVIEANESLRASVERTLRATQTEGAFGFDFHGVRSGAIEVASILETTPALEKALLEPLEEIKQYEDLDDELLLDFGEALGWWDQIRAHRVSTAGILLGFTVGLLKFVTSSASGQPIPENVFESVAAGGGVYWYLSNSARHRP